MHLQAVSIATSSEETYMEGTYARSGAGRLPRSHRGQHPHRGQLGIVLRSFLVLAVTLLLVLAGVAFTFGVVVPPGQMGVRQLTVGPNQGFSNHALPPGY